MVKINSAYIESGASLIANDAFTGTLTYERNLPTTNWYLISSPVIGQDIDSLAATEGLATGTANNLGLADYNNTTPGWVYLQDGATGTGVFTSGDARSLKLANAGDISFTGTMPVSNVGISITSDSNAFNLIGNPYPSFLPANNSADGNNTNNDDILSINSSKLTEETIWFWDESTNDYTEVNQASAGKFIAPTQGFFVSANGSETFIFTEAMQSHQGTDTFLKSTNTRTELQLLISDGTSSKDANIFYIEGTSTGFDNGFDSSLFGGVVNDFDVFTEAVANGNGKKLGIQSLPNSDLESMVIPVGIIADANKEVTFSANTSNLPGDLKVFLEDRATNTFTRLDEQNSNYKVTFTEAVNRISRFYLHTNSSALNTKNIALENVSIYTVDKSTLRVVGLLEGKSTIKNI